jgi:hypothetical protein
MKRLAAITQSEEASEKYRSSFRFSFFWLPLVEWPFSRSTTRQGAGILISFATIRLHIAFEH